MDSGWRARGIELQRDWQKISRARSPEYFLGLVGAWMFNSLYNTAIQWCGVELQGSNWSLFLSCQVFKWTGSNSFFVKGDLDSLMMGSGRCVSQSSLSLRVVCVLVPSLAQKG